MSWLNICSFITRGEGRLGKKCLCMTRGEGEGGPEISHIVCQKVFFPHNELEI